MIRSKDIKPICVVVLNSKDELLFIKRGREPYENQWALISGIGYIKKGLSLEEGVADEVMGDVGIKPTDIKFLFSLEDTLVYEAKVDEHEVSPQPPHVLDSTWKSINQTSELGPLAFEHEEILEKYQTLL